MEGRLSSSLSSGRPYSSGRFYSIDIQASSFDSPGEGTVAVFDELTGQSHRVDVRLSTSNDTLGKSTTPLPHTQITAG